MEAVEKVEEKEALELIVSLLRDLYEAQKRLQEPIYPAPPKIRVKVFRIGLGAWPLIDPDTGVTRSDALAYFRGSGKYKYPWFVPMHGCDADVAAHLLPERPTNRDILRVVRQIRAAIAWCHARREGLERAAAEITRQQAKVVVALQAEIAARKLA